MPAEVIPASALVAHVEADEPEGVLAALSELSDEMRAEAWEVLRRPLSAVLGPDDRAGFTEDGWQRHIRTRALVALAVGPSDIVRRVGAWVLLPEHPSDVDRVLGSRTPHWRGEFTAATLRAFASEPEVGLMGPFWWVWWQELRQRERNGVLCFDPSSADYLVMMIRGLLFSGSIVDAVHADAQLADRAIWSLFEPAPGVQKALLGAERFWDRSNTWRIALVRLALAGVLDDERLADAATIAAGDERMGRNHRAWYRKIPELLADPSRIPEPAEHGAPPAGNQLYRLS
ncbi:hypothetical protein GB931_16835 [Modestobacter sp. I12A-02628]|uniref:Uncharacterized protein n=1 Tax=Goekera deserti TaxID=2497753 RepID=A0A7K3WFW8_9ACTN|nr:hypothetical protein [Goekera deserti]MPQ99551.1 hypothetical protein [Goekera deserti]NDI46437.1 hypothetical protein [Goekera deserti]NEL54630.1 hypothetical protein [Goekera deserti]